MTLKDLKTDKSVIRILQFIILILLVVTCITVALANMDGALFLLTLPTAAVLVIVMAVQTLFVRDFYKKIPFYVLDSILLVLLTLFATWRKPPQTSTSYLYLVYALVLSEYYLSSPTLRDNIIMFAVNVGVYTIEYAVVALVSNSLASAFATSSQYFTDLIILILHFIMFSFAMTVYRKNKLIEKSMEELEESKNELLRAYDKLEEATLLEERNRISKDIHDTAGHSLTTVIMQTEAAKLMLDKNPEEAKKRIVAANVQAKNCLEELRLSVHLLSGRRENVSFKEYLESIVGKTTNGTDVTIRSKIDDVSMTEDAERFVGNLLREGISNGLRHGRSTAFFFELKDMGNFVEILLSDNGCGADLHTFKEGFGLSAMRNKAEKLGGMINFVSEAGEGFEINVSLPGALKTGAKEEKEKTDEN